MALRTTLAFQRSTVPGRAMGAGFHFPAFSTTWSDLDAFRHQHGVALWGTDSSGTALADLHAPPRLALVVGNEGGGLSDEARSRADVLAALPIGSVVESLNVAVATGIFLYQLRT